MMYLFFFFFSSRRRHTRSDRDWSSDVCSSDLAFAHTGPGQDARFVVPAFAERLRFAKRVGAPVVKVGNLEPVREFLHVRDVVDAYVRLLVRGHPGETYNVASGEGISLEGLFDRLAALVGVHPLTEADPDLVRGGDIVHLVGDATQLRAAAGA